MEEGRVWVQIPGDKNRRAILGTKRIGFTERHVMIHKSPASDFGGPGRRMEGELFNALQPRKKISTVALPTYFLQQDLMDQLPLDRLQLGCLFGLECSVSFASIVLLPNLNQNGEETHTKAL